jgi:hypothetical protein
MRFFAISSLLLTVTLSASAQLKVTNDGRVGVVTPTPNTSAFLSVGEEDNYPYSNYRFGVFTKLHGSKSFNIGIHGYATSTTHNDRTIGIQGIGGSGKSGWNYGVLGGLNTSRNGAGVFGTVYNITGLEVNGQYAGYFDGKVRITDTLYVPTVVTPSDLRLKENIVSLSYDETSALDGVLRINAITYNYKQRKYQDSDTASVSTLKHRQETEQQRHFGVLAQELKEIYPELVSEGQDGYLGVNYMELIPILIRSIQELKAELDEVKGKNDDTTKSRAAVFEDEETTAVGDATSIPPMATLAQNTPNPFSERTTIRFTLPENAQNAFIYIFDMSGKMQKQIPVTPDMQSVTIEGYELRAGMYIYSLVIGGKEMDTKRMILSR